MFRLLSHPTQSSFQTQFDIMILYCGPAGSGSIMWQFSICLIAEKGIQCLAKGQSEDKERARQRSVASATLLGRSETYHPEENGSRSA